MKQTTLLQAGRIRINGWFGTHEFLVRVLGETAKRLLVVSEKPWGIRSRRVDAHEPVLVPKTAVALVEQRP